MPIRRAALTAASAGWLLVAAACVEVDDRIFATGPGGGSDATADAPNADAGVDASGATDGGAGDASSDASAPPKLVVNEIIGSAPQYVELLNLTDAPLDLAGFKLTVTGAPPLDLLGILPARAFAGVMLSNNPPATGRVPCDVIWGFPPNLLCFALVGDLAGGTVSLEGPSSAPASEKPPVPLWGRLPDGTGSFQTVSQRSPGVANIP